MCSDFMFSIQYYLIYGYEIYGCALGTVEGGLTHYHIIVHFDALKIYCCGKH